MYIIWPVLYNCLYMSLRLCCFDDNPLLDFISINDLIKAVVNKEQNNTLSILNVFSILFRICIDKFTKHVVTRDFLSLLWILTFDFNPIRCFTFLFSVYLSFIIFEILAKNFTFGPFFGHYNNRRSKHCAWNMSNVDLD